MKDGLLENKDMKRYPHFDADISIEKANALVHSPDLVSKNAFFPFIMYEKKWQPFRSKVPKPEKKSRFIRYAARKDAYILAYYRSLLSSRYENRLVELSISDCPIAYRKIKKSLNSEAGKCNIDFAAEVFDKVSELQNCVFIALDISKCFESLDHSRLEAIWNDLLETTELPKDHAAIFKNITKYSYVEKEELFRKLNFFGPKNKNGKIVDGYYISYEDMPRKLCSNKDFKNLVAGGNSPSIIKQNKESYGVPQGAPISDLLANIYMIEFDVFAQKIAQVEGGIYRRYSDDILLVLPIGITKAFEIEASLISEIGRYGDQLKIKDSKTCIVKFHAVGNDLGFEHIKGKQGKNGAEYLGFRFDGKSVFLRDSTVSGLFRKMARSAKAHCRAHVSRYPGKDLKFLQEKLSVPRFLEHFSKVEEFDGSSDVKDWTFWTYASRAAKTFDKRGLPIYRQIKNQKRFIIDRLGSELKEAIHKS
jgi:Reverse transcriptase (RNA-dependent DNA polymerase)